MMISTRGMMGPVLMVVASYATLSCASKKGAQDAPVAPTAAAPSAAPAASAEPTASAAPAPSAAPTSAASAVAPAGSATAEPPPTTAESAAYDTAKLIMAAIHGKSGSKLSGQATFSDKGKGVKIFIEVEGAKPGLHGVHIHEYANCTTPDGSSAGGHFNPDGHDHGMPDKEMKHLGDLGNITIGNDGKGTLQIVVAGANLKDVDPHSFVLRGLIIHEKKDDGGQPVGNSGGRIGCAEIK